MANFNDKTIAVIYFVGRQFFYVFIGMTVFFIISIFTDRPNELDKLDIWVRQIIAYPIGFIIFNALKYR
jgi:hypothetical protein